MDGVEKCMFYDSYMAHTKTFGPSMIWDYLSNKIRIRKSGEEEIKWHREFKIPHVTGKPRQIELTRGGK